MTDGSWVQTVREECPAARRFSYLNTGTIGIMPEPVLEKLVAWVRWYNEEGPALPEVRGQWRREREEAREVLCRFFRAGEDEMEFVTDTTAGMNAIIGSLPLREGDEVLVSDIEHYAGLVPWTYSARRRGLEVKVVPARGGVVCLDDIDRAVSERTRVISISHVSFTTGGRSDIAAIGAYAQERDIFLLVDGAQGAGALDLDFGALNCDAYAFPGYKWCLGPEGSGALYISARVHDRLDPPTVALGATEEMDLDGEYTLRRGARLFAPSTPGFMQTVGLGYALEYLEVLRMGRVQRHIEELTGRLVAGLHELSGVELITPHDPARRAGLVSFRVQGVRPEEMRDAVDEFISRGLHVRVVPRPAAFRASLHVYNDGEDVEWLLELIRGRFL